MLEAIDEAASGARRRACRSSFALQDRQASSGGRTEVDCALVEKFRREGVDVVVDQYPYERSSTNLGITLPSWALADGSREDQRATDRRRPRATKIAVRWRMKLANLGHETSATRP